MDWTALQRTTLALTSGVPCLAVQSAREQQSLHTWYLQSEPAALRRWHLVMGALHLCALLQLFTDNLDRTELLQTVLGR